MKVGPARLLKLPLSAFLLCNQYASNPAQEGLDRFLIGLEHWVNVFCKDELSALRQARLSENPRKNKG